MLYLYLFQEDRLKALDEVKLEDILGFCEYLKQNSSLYFTWNKKDVPYEFDIIINDELLNLYEESSINVKNIGNTIDILPILWENILVEIPIRIVKSDSDIITSGDGWKLVTEGEEDGTTSAFDKLKDLSNSCEDEWLQNIPLFLVCSTYIDYKEENAHFKQEYIIPQLLLEYIINETLLKDKQEVEQSGEGNNTITIKTSEEVKNWGK